MRARLSTLIAVFTASFLLGVAGQASATERYVLAWWRQSGATEGGTIIRVYVFDENGDPLGGRKIYTSWGVLQSTTSTEPDRLGWCNDIVLDPANDRDVLVEDAAISDVSPLFSNVWVPSEKRRLYEVGFMYKADASHPGTFDTATNCTFNAHGSADTDAPYTKSLIYNGIDCTNEASDQFSLGNWGSEFSQTFTVPSGINRIAGVNVWGAIGENYRLRVAATIKQGGPTGPVVYSRNTNEVYGGEVSPFRDAQWIPFGANACPVTPGGTYCLSLTRVDENNDPLELNSWHVANVYGGGQYYEVTTPFASQDLAAFVVGMSYQTTGAGQIAGIITDTDGSPIAEAVVTADPGGYETETGVDGTYALTNVAPGTYTVESWKPGYSRVSQSGVAVVADQTTTVNLALAPRVNLLTNPGFESEVLTGWDTWGAAMSAFGCDSWAIPCHSGGRYAGAVTNGGTKNGGLYQRVTGLQAGQTYTAAGWFYTDSWANNRQDEYPTNCQARIGISPSGSTDSASGDIVWSAWAWSQNHWSPFYVDATATATAVTVFLEYKQQYPYEWNKNAFDDLWLSGPGYTATSPTLGAGWNLISLPADPDDPSPAAVFSGITIDGRLYRYTPGVGYQVYTNANPAGFGGDCQAGEGYWLYLTAPAAISYSGVPLVGTQQLALPSGGWHLVGQPHSSATPLASCTVSDLSGGGGTQSFYDAALSGWVGGRLYYYDPSAGGYAVLGQDPWSGSDELTPWSGYWLWTANMDLGLNVP
jgi:hypothetical protein